MPEPEELQQLVGPSTARCDGRAGEHHRQLHVLRSRQVRHEVLRGALPHEPDLAPPERPHLAIVQKSEVAPTDRHRPGRRAVDPADEVQDAGLPGAAGADDGGERAREDLEADAAERRDAGVSHSVHLVDAVEPDRHRRHSGSPRRTADADAVLIPAAETRSPIASVTAEATAAASAAFRSTRSFGTPTATLGTT